MIRQDVFDNIFFIAVLIANMPKILYSWLVSDKEAQEFFQGFIRPYPKHEKAPENFAMQVIVVLACVVNVATFAFTGKYLHDFLIEEAKRNMILSLFGVVLICVGVAVNLRNSKRFMQYDLFYQELVEYHDNVQKQVLDLVVKCDKYYYYYEQYLQNNNTESAELALLE